MVFIENFRARSKPILLLVLGEVFIAEHEVLGFRDVLVDRSLRGEQPRDKTDKGEGWTFLLRSLLQRESILTSEAD